MSKICYEEWNPSPDSMALVITANEIIEEYDAMGYSLTLRQLYYQFVARGLIENSQRSYNRMGTIINKGRLGGFIDWESIEDRTRNVESNAHWDSPADLAHSCEKQFAIDKWASQPYTPEVWVEKEALVGVVERICKRLDTPRLACRGYMSQSEQWRAGQRLLFAAERGQIPVVFHLGDHDPSGIDMTRDNEERLRNFMLHHAERGMGDEVVHMVQQFEVKRLALNMDQVEQYSPPPNPAKLTDSRAVDYISKYGRSSWELDALEPSVLETLIKDALEGVRDMDKWQLSVQEEQAGKKAFRDFRQQLEKEEE